MKFTIKKGRHYSNKFIHKFLNLLNNDRKSCYFVKFTESCLYEIEGEDKYDVNKLFGFSVGYDDHINSARFGWNIINNEVCIYTYCYVNKERLISFIDTVEIDRIYKLQIIEIDNKYIFTVTDTVTSELKQFSVNRKFDDTSLYYNLWPYFGGNQKSPKDIDIFMENCLTKR